MPASALGLRFRGSDLADHQVVVSARFALAPGDRAASEAELAEIVRWRREHQPGGQNAGLGVRQPVPVSCRPARSSTPSGCGACASARPRCRPKHANFIQADEGGSGRRRPGPDGRGAGPGAGGAGHRAAQRDPPDRLRRPRRRRARPRGGVVKLLGAAQGRQGGRGLAAGTVSPDAVFVDREGQPTAPAQRTAAASGEDATRPTASRPRTRSASARPTRRSTRSPRRCR